MHGLKDGAGRQPNAAATAPGRRVRVLTVTRDAGSGVGGTEVLVQEIARRLDRRQFESYMCVTRRPEADRLELFARERAELERDGVKVLALDRGSSWSIPPWARLLRLMAREQIDVVHAHMPRASVPSTVLARLARVPVMISHEHGSVLEGKVVRRLLDRHVVARGSDAILAVSEWDRKNIAACEGIDPERITVLRNGIAPAPPAGALRRSDFAPPGVGLVGAVGRLVPVKGYDDLIEAIALLRHRGIPVACLIAGEGPDRPRLEQRIERLDVADSVRLLGFRNDVADLLAVFDVTVLPSHSEGAPLAAMEYMAAGAPIVATAVGGIPELIEDGVHGLLVPARSPAGLAEALERLLRDRKLSERLAHAAGVRQRTEYDIDRMVTRLEALYLRLLETSPRARVAAYEEPPLAA